MIAKFFALAVKATLAMWIFEVAVFVSIAVVAIGYYVAKGVSGWKR